MKTTSEIRDQFLSGNYNFSNQDWSNVKFDENVICEFKCCTQPLYSIFYIRKYGMNLNEVKLPIEPKGMLLIDWGPLSDELTSLCIAYDQSLHPHPERFEIWAKGGRCPYDGYQYSSLKRAVNFMERRYCWKSDAKVLSSSELVSALVKEVCYGIQYHDQ